MINSRKFFALNIILIILLSSAVVLYVLPSAPAAKGEGFTSLDLSVSPSDSSFKLGVNQSQTFLAQALNGTAPFTYTWTVNPSGNFTLSVNGELKEVSNASSLQVSGSELTLSYPVATEEFVSFTVSVKDANGYSGSIWQPIVVADPYTSPGYKFDASTATASYIITADGLGWYRAIKGSTGEVSWSSTNYTSVLASITNSASVGSTVYVQSGIFGTKEAHLIVGNATEVFTAGKVAYQSSPNFYSVASASANSTIGYGYVWLIAINSNTNANCLLMNDGVFTLGSWSLSAGLAWVSTTGTVTSTYPSATGNQLVSIGSMLNATTLQVSNPHGDYGEHV
jgi:hypothetical protein